jgi:hypothetical protein
MKQGCLILLAITVIGFFGYQHLLEGTELSSIWGIPLALGILAAMVAGNAQGILQALRHIRASKRNQAQWRDNDLIVISGRLQAQKTALVAPISGKSATIVEYELKRYFKSNNSTSSSTDYRGCLMTPSTIQSSTAQVSIVGFPLLTHWGSESYEDPDSYKRLAKYLLENPSTTMPTNPLAAIAELNKVLKDDDGDVKANYRVAKATNLQEYARVQQDSSETEDLNDEPLPQDELDEEDRELQGQIDQFKDSQDPTEKIIHFLRQQGYSLYETIIPNGAEITIMGSYRANKRQVDIGSGLSNINHGIHKGTLSQVLGKNLKKSIILTSIFACIFLGANYFLLMKIGIEPESIIDQFHTWSSSLQAKVEK